MVSANASSVPPPEQKPEVEASKRIVNNSKTTAKLGSSSNNRLRTPIMLNRQHLPFILFVIVFAVVGSWILLRSHAEETSTDTTTNLSTNIDYSSQAAVNSAYWKLWVPSMTTTYDWNGKVATCDPGTMAYTYRNAEVDAINFARRLQQLAPIVATDATANSNAIKAGLVIRANGNKLSHYLTQKDYPNCWSEAGKGGAYSALRSDIAEGPSLLGQYVADFLESPGEKDVGHRRMLFLYQSTIFGIGTNDANAVVQMNDLPPNWSNPRPATMWPMKGYFPSTLAPGYIPQTPTQKTPNGLPGIWSYTSGSLHIKFGQATVSVTHNGAAVTVTQYPAFPGEAVNGRPQFGNPTLAWIMPMQYETSGDYTVTIKNIKNTSTGQLFSRSYTIHFFNPVQ